jgi:hypothetical protein
MVQGRSDKVGSDAAVSHRAGHGSTLEKKVSANHVSCKPLQAVTLERLNRRQGWNGTGLVGC